jgi:RNA polymerase sigma factor (sigma-70 family)
MKLNDREILEGIKNCDSKVLEYVYRNFFLGIRQFVMVNSGNLDDAKDAFQDALNVVFEKIRNDELQLNAGFGTFLFSVAKKIWLHELRRNSRMIQVSGEWDDISGPDPDIIVSIIKVERQKLFIKHLENMNSECKKLLELMSNEVPNNDIATMMGYSSEQYAKNRKTKCFDRLMERIAVDPTFKELQNEKF